MVRLHILAFVFASFVLVLPAASAIEFIPVEVGIEPKYIKTDLEMPIIFSLNVKNNQNFMEQLRIAVEGPHIHWVTNPIILLVVPINSSKSVDLTFYPVEHRGSFDFDIATYSHRTFMGLDLQSIHIEIPPPLIVGNFSVSKDGAAITTSIDTDAISEKAINFTSTLYDTNDNIIGLVSSNHTIKGRETLSQVLVMPENPLAGDYLVTYVINDSFSGEQSFLVEPIHNVERTEELDANALFGIVTVTYKNSGNIAESNYVTKEILPTITITGFITNPRACESGLVDKACTYVIADLQPGATAQISYRVEYWPYYVQITAAAIIIFVVASFTVLRAAKPTIAKTSVRKTTNMHSVILEIKNPFLHHLKDVVIRDWVSPLAHVTHEQTGSIRPVLKKSGAGTELIWKLGEINPKEVRYLSYRIRTLVEGNLKMPRAYARFRTPQGGRFRIYSKFLHL